MADLGLADAVDAAEALLDPVRVPREVVVDHEVGALEVQALAGGVGRDQDPGVDVLGEQLFSLGALITPDAAVDGDDGVAAAEEIADALGEVLKGVAVLGEDDDLLAGDHRVVGEQLAELGPLLVRAAVPYPPRQLDQVGEEREFLVELGDRAGGGGRVGDLRLDLLGLLAWQVVAVHGARVGQVGLGGVLAEQVAQAPGEVVVGARAAAVAHLAAALLQALVASFERLEDRLGRGRQAPLQDREGEADGEAALLVTGVAQPVGEVHLVADVLRDGVVEDLLVLGQLVGDGVGAALGEQRLALERLEVLLDHAAHQPVGVHGVHRVAVPALEPVGVEQRHEQLEVLFAARVRGRGHQQEVPGGLPEELAELVALGLLQLVAEVVGGHPVRLVDHDQVPVGALKLLLELIGPGELVHPRDQQVVPGEDVAVRLGVRELPGQQLEGEAELLPQLVLPLLDKPAGRDDQAALQVTAEHQLLDVEARHDRLPGAGVVGEQEPQRGPLDQLAVDGLDLVRERFEVGGVDREHRVEPAGHPDPERLGGELEGGRVGGEVVGGGALGQLQAGFVVAVEEALVEFLAGRAVGEAQRVAADPRGGDHRYRRIAADAGDLRAGRYVLKLHRVLSGCSIRRDDSRGDHRQSGGFCEHGCSQSNHGRYTHMLRLPIEQSR